LIAWKQLSTYGLISPCERYRIGKAIVGGKAVYSLFDGFDLVGRYASAGEAKAACEAHKKAPAE
jgi:hypothetical protein